MNTQVARFLAAHSIALAFRGLPGIYFHSLFGSRGDRPGAEESGIPRRINRQKLDVTSLTRELDEPGTLRARVFTGLRQMIEARGSHPAFSPYAAQVVPDAPADLFLITRKAPEGREVLCATNVTASAVSFPLPRGNQNGHRCRIPAKFGRSNGSLPPTVSRGLRPRSLRQVPIAMVKLRGLYSKRDRARHVQSPPVRIIGGLRELPRSPAQPSAPARCRCLPIADHEGF